MFTCFQARIAFLQGERKGQENLKNDLVRRIKMLEYALKQERAKYAKLKYGGDSGQAIVAANALDATRQVSNPLLRIYGFRSSSNTRIKIAKWGNNPN